LLNSNLSQLVTFSPLDAFASFRYQPGMPCTSLYDAVVEPHLAVPHLYSSTRVDTYVFTHYLLGMPHHISLCAARVKPYLDFSPKTYSLILLRITPSD